MATKNLSDRPVLRVEGLCVSYGKVEAVRNASLTLAQGSIVTVIGANGYGGIRGYLANRQSTIGTR